MRIAELDGADQVTISANRTGGWRCEEPVSIEDLDRGEIERIVALATNFGQVADRPIKKLPSLRGRLVINLFYEASTRTRSSFELAAKRLSADVLNLVASGSSVEKGESLRDTVATLSAYGPDAIVIRSPHAGAPALVAAWTHAAVVNAGDGKHQHPTQALLDCYALKQRLGSLDGCKIWIVGDVPHSRVARSCIQAFRLLGAQVTVAGPPTLVPDEFAQLGATVRHSLDACARPTWSTRCGCSSSGWRTPSCRRCASTRALPDRLAAPRGASAADAPRTGQPRIELSGEVIDSPQSLITDQVAAGVVVRMAVLYEVLAGAPPETERPTASRPRSSRRPHERAGRRAAPAGRAALARRTCARPWRRDRRGPRRACPRR